MTKLYIATHGAVAIVSQHHGEWAVDLQMVGSQPQCLAVDSQRPQQVYCGTFDQGLWRSENAGDSWEHVGAGRQPHGACRQLWRGVRGHRAEHALPLRRRRQHVAGA